MVVVHLRIEVNAATGSIALSSDLLRREDANDRENELGKAIEEAVVAILTESTQDKGTVKVDILG